MPENKIYKPSFLGLIPTALGVGFFLLLFSISAVIAFPLAGLLIFILFLVIIFLFYLSIKLTSFELRSDGLFIKRGIIAKKQILLLYSQIQDVTEYQNLSRMILGLKNLQIETMTTSSAIAGLLSNLKSDDADELKQKLLEIVNSKSKSKQKNANVPAVKYDALKEQDLESVNPYPLHFVRMGVLIGVVCFIILIIAGLVLSNFNLDDETDIYLIIWGVIIIFIPIGYIIRQVSFKYWISENTVTIKSGLINTQKTSMEYEKIQDIIFSQGIIERILGLASIRFETGSVVVPQGRDNKQRPNYQIDALSIDDAKTLSDKIIKKLGINYTPSKNPLVQQIPLEPKKVIKKSLIGLLGLGVVFGIIIFVLWLFTITNSLTSELFSMILFFGVILFVALVIWIPIYQKMYYDRYYYDWSANTLTIRKGVIGREQIYLQFEKIQNVFVDQDLFDRMFGLYDVHLSTVGFGSIRLCHTDGLSKVNADKMKEVLLKQVKRNG